MTRVNFVLTLYLLHLGCRNLSVNESYGAGYAASPYLKTVCGPG
jgi:hypothetical protein